MRAEKKKKLILFHELPIACSSRGGKLYAKLDEKNKHLSVSICNTQENAQLIAYFLCLGKNKFNILIPKTHYKMILPSQKLFNCYFIHKDELCEYPWDGLLKCKIKRNVRLKGLIYNRFYCIIRWSLLYARNLCQFLVILKKSIQYFLLSEVLKLCGFGLAEVLC